MSQHSEKHRLDDKETMKEEEYLVSSNMDSGFISSGNIMSSQISSESESDDEKLEDDFTSEPGKATRINRGGNFSQNLKDSTLSKESEFLDSGLISEELSSEIIEEEKPQELWEIYYTQDDDGDTQLHLSVIQGFPEAACFLIEISPHPCLLDIHNDDCQTALHLAVITHQPTIVRKLILAGADPTVRDFKGNTPLHLACMSGDLSCVKELVRPLSSSEKLLKSALSPKISQDLEQPNYNGERCLHVAALKGHVEILRELIFAGASVEAGEGLGGRTALHLAIESGRPEVVDVLLREGDIKQFETCTYAGLTAWDVAYLCADEEIKNKLINLGAKPSTWTPQSDDEDDDDDDDDDNVAKKGVKNDSNNRDDGDNDDGDDNDNDDQQVVERAIANMVMSSKSLSTALAGA